MVSLHRSDEVTSRICEDAGRLQPSTGPQQCRAHRGGDAGDRFLGVAGAQRNSMTLVCRMGFIRCALSGPADTGNGWQRGIRFRSLEFSKLAAFGIIAAKKSKGPPPTPARRLEVPTTGTDRDTTTFSEMSRARLGIDRFETSDALVGSVTRRATRAIRASLSKSPRPKKQSKSGRSRRPISRAPHRWNADRDKRQATSRSFV